MTKIKIKVNDSKEYELSKKKSGASGGTIVDRRRAMVLAHTYMEGRMYWVQWRCEKAKGNSRYYPALLTRKTETHLEWSWLDQ